MFREMCSALDRAQTVCPWVSAADRQRLAAILADRNQPQKHVARVRIILAAAERLDVAAIARQAGLSRPAVWRWQLRFAEAGGAGLRRDRTRRPGKPPTPEAVVQRVVALTCAEPPGAATHWTGRMMAKAAGLSLRTVPRIWAAHQLQPHRIRTFKRSRDPEFMAKRADIVGLYLAPPRHAVVLSVALVEAIQTEAFPGWTSVTVDLLSVASYEEQKQLDRALVTLRGGVERNWRDPGHQCSIAVIPPAARDTPVIFYAFPQQLFLCIPAAAFRHKASHRAQFGSPDTE